jgi:hypothetical protein
MATIKAATATIPRISPSWAASDIGAALLPDCEADVEGDSEVGLPETVAKPSTLLRGVADDIPDALSPTECLSEEAVGVESLCPSVADAVSMGAEADADPVLTGVVGLLVASLRAG